MDTSGDGLLRMRALAARLRLAWMIYYLSFFQPLARWPIAQRLSAWLVIALAVWFAVCRLGLIIDVSGRGARRQALTALEQRVAQARQQAKTLPAMRHRASALGSSGNGGNGGDCAPVSENSALLCMISSAVDQSGVTLARFEPGRVTQIIAGEGENAVVAIIDSRVSVRGAYHSLARFIRVLAAVPQAAIVISARITPLRRADNRLETLEAVVRVIGDRASRDATFPIERVKLEPFLLGASLVDPFGEGGGLAGRLGEVTASRGEAALLDVAGGEMVGRFQSGERRAVLLRMAGGWRLVPLPGISSDSQPKARP